MDYREFRNNTMEYVRNINVKLKRILLNCSEKYELTDNQLYLLAFLKQKGSANIGEIAAEFNSDCANISPMCKKMEKRGLLQKERLKEDERVVMVTLSEQGKLIVKEVFGKLDEGFGSVFGEISEADAKNILYCLQKFDNSLQQLTEESKC